MDGVPTWRVRMRRGPSRDRPRDPPGRRCRTPGQRPAHAAQMIIAEPMILVLGSIRAD